MFNITGNQVVGHNHFFFTSRRHMYCFFHSCKLRVSNQQCQILVTWVSDMMYGNPRPSGIIDPGYRHPVYDVSCGDLTADQRLRIPRKIAVRKAEACSLDFSTEFMSSTSHYSSLLSKHIHFNLGIGGSFNVGFKSFDASASFLASHDYKKVEKAMESNTNYVMQTSCSCTAYSGSINSFDSPSFHEGFEKAVAQLPAFGGSVWDHYYDKFIAEFGTFYVKEVLMGAFYGQQVVMSKSSLCNFHETN